MPTQNRRTDDPHGAHEACEFDLSELSALYGEQGLRTLLGVALDEFDCQRLVFEGAFDESEWARAAQAMHRLAGTAAFFVRDDRALDSLALAERALRLGDTPLIAQAVPAARAMLTALRAAFVVEKEKADAMS